MNSHAPPTTNRCTTGGLLGRRLRPWLLGLLLGCCGCTRSFWRTQADVDVYQAIGEKLTDPRWVSPRLDITPDPRSRFYDPFDPDESPLPPDDPAAHALMHCVDGWRGYRGWHKFGNLLNVENPHWLAQFGITPEMIDPATGAYVGVLPALERVTLPQAVELSLIHSPVYQTQLENVYLAALDVTFERFQFGVRYLGIGRREPSLNANYDLRPHGPSDRLSLGTRFGLSQVLPAGGQIAVELANNTLWLFGQPSTSSATALSYSIVQPLLIGAGRKLVLENLTQAERSLLYAIRDLARFRQQFFTDVVGSNVGFLGLLQQMQLIRNQQDNISRLERQVAELQAVSANFSQVYRVPLRTFPADLPIPDLLKDQLEYNPLDEELIWRGPLSDEQEQALRQLTDVPAIRSAINELIETIRVVPASLDVLTLQSRLAQSRNELRSRQLALQDSLDAFKRLLGLPPDIPLGIDDGLLQQFQFIDPMLRALEAEVEGFVVEWGRVDEDDPPFPSLVALLERYLALAEEVERRGVTLVDQNAQAVTARLPERLAALPTEADRDRVRSDIDGDRRRLENVRSRLETTLVDARRLQESLLAQTMPPDVESRQEIRAHIKRLQEDLLQVVRGLTVIQIALRLELIDIEPFNLGIEDAVATAIQHRVDLMNARAEVMDARRRVEIAANRLLSAVDLVAEGDVRNTGGENPVDFRLDRSEFRVGVQFTAPLDQIAERNAYRTALIAYQRARRNYMAAEDAVKQQVRDQWRSLDILKRNLETSRQGIRIAALQLDSAAEESTAPDVGGRAGSGVRGQALLTALDAVLRAQDDLLRNWVNYERNRLNIHRDMGIMEVGPDGLWNDPVYRGTRHAAPTHPSPGSEPPGGDSARHRPGAAGLRGDGRDRDAVVLVGGHHGGEREPRLVPPATGHGGPGPVPGQHSGPGVRRQPEERHPRQ